MNKKTIFPLCVIVLLITLCFFFLWKRSDPTQIKLVAQEEVKAMQYKTNSAVANETRNINDLDSALLILKLKEHCPKLKKHIFTVNPSNTSRMARNIHFKKGEEVYRLRVFLEDSAEKSFEKLVFYKEDSDGFAKYQKIPKADEINPSDDTIRKYIKEFEIIYDESDMSLKTDKGSVFYTLLNGELVKALAPQFDCYFERKKP